MASEPAKLWNNPKPPACEFCGAKIDSVFIDGKTLAGPWAIQCPGCHAEQGRGLGKGRGQRYELRDGVFVKTGG